MYTKIPNTQCNGWARISFDDCKQKCMNNALPNSCDGGEPSKNCTFAVWDGPNSWTPGRCHLAENGCTNEDLSHESQLKIWKRIGESKFMNIFKSKIF